MIYKNSICTLFIIYTTAIMVACAKATPSNQIVIPSKESSMRYIKNGRIKLGVDLNLGGAVTYLSDSENGGDNMINSFDWGRQIQQSYYSGPWPYIGPNGETPTAEWAGLGWNPIQSGDAGNNRSKVIQFNQLNDSSFLIQSIPMQWPHKTGIAGECIFESLYILEGNVITLKASIINKRADQTQYVACAQEMPAVYTNGSRYKIVTYLGDEPFSNQPLTEVITKGDNKGWPWVHFYTPENWVALIDDAGLGIGVYQADVLVFNAGFHLDDKHKGHGGEKDVQTGHIAPIGKQILDHNISWTYETKFILGDLNDIRSSVYKFKRQNKKMKWDFEIERQYWYFEGDMRDKGYPLKGALDITYNKESSLVSPVTFWKASDNKSIVIEGIFATNSNELILNLEIQPVGKSDFTDWLNWSEGASNAEQERKLKAQIYPGKSPIKLQHKIAADGVTNIHEIDLSSIQAYTGAMKSVKLTMNDRGTARIESIYFK